MMNNDEMRFIVEAGLKRHALVDQCRCDYCVRSYGPMGSPGRCGHCRDSEQGVVCSDRSAYLALRVMLDESDGVAPMHIKREDCPWCVAHFCNDCDKRVRQGVSPSYVDPKCPKCGGSKIEIRGIKHTSLVKAAEHRMKYRLDQMRDRIIPPIFYRLPDGRWGVKGSDLKEGDEVMVSRRDGEEVSVVVGRILDTDEYGSSVAQIARTTGWN